MLASASSGGRLVRLELENFKSYAGKQVIGPFEENFVCVIGPNGAGKSNLMDALSFVLGLQSGQLRSHQLADLIYRKSRDDRRGGAASSATVTAIYERLPAGESVAFSRRVTANGHSEYRINGRVTPYAEYVKVWEAENVLIRARNFLVFQGDVEAIASKSPKELTKLFEQISGSDEFREEYERCKLAYDRAVEESSLNFNKKRGVGTELKLVQEQREDVLKFEQLTADKMSLQTEYYLWKLFHVEEAGRRIGSVIEEREGELAAAEEQVKSTEVAWKEARKGQAKVQKDLLALDKKVKAASKAVQDEAPASVQLEERQKLLKQKLSTVGEGHAQAEHDLEAQSRELVAAQAELKKVEEASTAFDQEASTNLAASSISEDLLAEYNELKARAMEATAKERLKLESLQRKLAPDFANRDQLRGKLEELETAMRRVDQERAQICSKLDKISGARSDLDEHVGQVQRELSLTQAKRLKLEQTEVELTERLREIMAKLLDAKVDQQESERELKQRATLESLKRIFPGVHGRMIDLCRPSQRKYEQPVSIALGKNLDSIVVDQERTAIACIQYLREQRAGQATFIPLDTIQAGEGSTAAAGIAGKPAVEGCRPMLEVIKFDATYGRAFQYAIGSAVICETLEQAKHLCFDLGVRVKAITLDGAIIHKSGLMTGGATAGGNQQHRRWEGREIGKLKTERDSCASLLAETSKQLRRNESDERLRTSLIELQTRRAFVQDEIAALERKLASINEEGLHIQQEQARCQEQLGQLDSSLVRHERELRALERTINEAEEGIFANFCRRINFPSIRAFETNRQSLAQEIAERRLALSSVTSKLHHQIAFLTQQLASTRDRLTELARLREEYAQAEAALEQERGTLFARVEGKRQALEILQAEHAALKAKIRASEEVIDERRASLTAAQAHLTALSKDITTSECEVDRLLASRKSLLRTCKMEEIDLPLMEKGLSLMDLDLDSNDGSDGKLAFDYGCLSRAARNHEQMAIHERKYQERIRLLQEELDKLAPNLRALEKLEGVETRLRSTMESFERTRAELRRAKEAFASVRRQRYDRFQNAFKRIAGTIDTIYKELTKSDLVPLGGTAFLSLESGEEPYCEGIRFHAMPPLKRFLDMDQLSGGERTVAALALLFAIHSYRPAPFFILDEIDAALDSANVSKVASFIRARSLGMPLAENPLDQLIMSGQPAPADRQPPMAASSPLSASSASPSSPSVPVQFLVISLKSSLYARAGALVGIYREPDARSSRVLTIRLADYPEQ